MTAIFIAAFLALPLIVFRGRTLFAYLTIEPVTYLFAWLIWLRVPHAVTPAVFVAVFAAVKLAIFSIALAAGEHVRWSAARAAMLAAIVYFAAIPAMTRHVIDGDGGTDGPDLSRIGAQHDIEYLKRLIADPESVNADAEMPAFRKRLTDAELDAVAAYLAARK